MKKLVYNVGIVCLLALVCNCSNDELPTEDFKYVVTFGESYDTLSWSDMVDSVRYIPLKTPDGALMGDIKQLVVASIFHNLSKVHLEYRQIHVLVLCHIF